VSTQAEQERPDGAGRPEGDDRDRDERAAYEAELSRITSADIVFQAAVSLLNIGAYRMGLVGAGGSEPDRASAREGGSAMDLEQVRDAIDAVRGLLPVLERSAPQELRPLRDALSQLQLAYTGAAQPASPGPPVGAGGGPPTDRPAKPGDRSESGQSGPGPAESSGRLWVPGR
jgi:hypothetical protein